MSEKELAEAVNKNLIDQQLEFAAASNDLLEQELDPDWRDRHRELNAEMRTIVNELNERNGWGR